MTQDIAPTYNAVRTAAGYFILVLLGALLASLIGGGFGAMIASISPGFVKSLFSLKPEDGNEVRYALSVGMIWGLFIGVAGSCFACLLATILRIFRLRVDYKAAEKTA
jgi:hypothetical protein